VCAAPVFAGGVQSGTKAAGFVYASKHALAKGQGGQRQPEGSSCPKKGQSFGLVGVAVCFDIVFSSKLCQSLMYLLAGELPFEIK
jgi:hypothetical protein